MLASITLVGVRAGNGRARAKARCEPGPLLCSVAITALLAMGLGPKVLKQKCKESGVSWFPSLEVCSLPPAVAPLHYWRTAPEQKGLEQVPGMGWGTLGWS